MLTENASGSHTRLNTPYKDAERVDNRIGRPSAQHKVTLFCMGIIILALLLKLYIKLL